MKNLTLKLGAISLAALGSASNAFAFTIDSSNYVEQSASKTVGANQTVGITATCPSGDVIVSGICYDTTGSTVPYLIQVGESGKNSWTCVYASTVSGTYYSVAMCAHQ
jgi:hypothetical protein